MSDAKLKLIGSPPTLEWISVNRLDIDERYQRSVESPQSRRVIYGMIKCWDWRLCQPLNVSRRADGRLFVVDGQHRLVGARERGDLAHLPCVVSQHDDHADEAHTFVALNFKRQKLSQGDIFAASLASGDGDAARTLELITAAGLTLARNHTPANWKPGQIFCAPSIQTALKLYGERIVQCALIAISEAYEGKVLERAATLLKPIYVVYAEDAKRPGFDPDRFIRALGSVDQQDWGDHAREQRRKNPAMSVRDGYVAAFMEQYAALEGVDDE